MVKGDGVALAESFALGGEDGDFVGVNDADALGEGEDEALADELGEGFGGGAQPTGSIVGVP